jgi:hypothetical protein
MRQRQRNALVSDTKSHGSFPKEGYLKLVIGMAGIGGIEDMRIKG